MILLLDIRIRKKSGCYENRKIATHTGSARLFVGAWPSRTCYKRLPTACCSAPFLLHISRLSQISLYEDHLAARATSWEELNRSLGQTGPVTEFVRTDSHDVTVNSGVNEHIGEGHEVAVLSDGCLQSRRRERDSRPNVAFVRWVGIRT